MFVHKPDRQCICDRSQTAVFCTNCQDYFKGRVYRICPVHPHVFYFQDYKVCRQCKNGGQLMEIDAEKLKKLNL